MYPSVGDVSWRGSFVKEQVEAYKALYPKSNVEVFHIKGKISGESNLNYIRRLPGLLKKLFLGNYDIVHCHHAFCVLLCVPWYKRLIYTVHEGELNNTSLRSKIIKKAIFLSGKVIFVSQKEYERHTENNKFFLPCGVDFDIFKVEPNKPALRAHLGLPQNKKIILFPADPSRPEKNANILKEAEKLSLLEKKPWHFIYGGKIDKSEMPKWMAASDIVVSIGKYESDGMVVKEAIACNTPVVSTDVGNSKIYVKDGCGVITTPTPEQTYKSIKYILENPNKFKDGREKLVRLGQDMTTTANKLHAIYEETLS